MTKLIGTLAAAAMVLAPALAIAQDDSEWQSEEAQPEAAPPPPPAELPPSPPAQAQPIPPDQVQPQAPPPPERIQAQAPVPPGQWVYTQQYGWIWMPYADLYTRVPANGYGEPYAFVYAPAYSCWAWLAAPWVWGIGPWPVFGVYGAVRFGWYGHGWWRYPTRWHYAPSYASYGYRPGYGGGWGHVRPAPYPRGQQGFARPAPSRGGSGAVRPAPPRGGFAGPRGMVAPRGGGAAFVGRGGGQGFAPPRVATGSRGFQASGQVLARPHAAMGGRGAVGGGGGFVGRSAGGRGGHGGGHGRR